MKITTFNPQIITKNAGAAVKFFEELGFEKTHTKKAIGELDVIGIRMKNADGFYVDISQVENIPVDAITGIRMNVDNFDEAFELLTARGFKSFYGDKTADTPTSKSAIMIAPCGYTINLVEHIKK